LENVYSKERKKMNLLVVSGLVHVLLTLNKKKMVKSLGPIINTFSTKVHGLIRYLSFLLGLGLDDLIELLINTHHLTFFGPWYKPTRISFYF
jgi:hypothetical protein